MSIRIAYDEEGDVVTIEGVSYSGDFFRQFGRAPMGTILRVAQRLDGAISVIVERVGESGE